MDFTGFRMALLALPQSPVDLTLQAWLVLNILLDFTIERAFTTIEGLTAPSPKSSPLDAIAHLVLDCPSQLTVSAPFKI